MVKGQPVHRDGPLGLVMALVVLHLEPEPAGRLASQPQRPLYLFFLNKLAYFDELYNVIVSNPRWPSALLLEARDGM